MINAALITVHVQAVVEGLSTIRLVIAASVRIVTGRKMFTEIPPARTEVKVTVPLDFFRLRVLIWKDGDTYAGQCLETGSVATANDFHELRNTMFTLLTQEHDFNINEEGSVRNLLHTPAPFEIWQRYHDLIQNRNADFVSGVTMLDASY